MTAQRKLYTEDGENSSPGDDAQENVRETAAAWGFDIPDAVDWPEPTELTGRSKEEGGDTLTLPLALLPKPLSSYASATAKCMGTLTRCHCDPCSLCRGCTAGPRGENPG
jgi:hypothetical protein